MKKEFGWSLAFRDVHPNPDYKSVHQTAAVLIDAADNPDVCETAMAGLSPSIQVKFIRRALKKLFNSSFVAYDFAIIIC